MANILFFAICVCARLCTMYIWLRFLTTGGRLVTAVPTIVVPITGRRLSHTKAIVTSESTRWTLWRKAVTKQGTNSHLDRKWNFSVLCRIGHEEKCFDHSRSVEIQDVFKSRELWYWAWLS